MDEYLLPEALDKIYGFLWDDFCDWYIEFSKLSFHTNAKDKERKMSILINIFAGCLKMLHPFIPFITEEIFNELKEYINSTERFLIKEKMPSQIKKAKKDDTNILPVQKMMEAIKTIRTLRAQFLIPPQKELKAIISSSNGELNQIKNFENHIKMLARLSELQFQENLVKPSKSLSAVSGNFNIHILIEGDIDIEKEKQRLKKEYEVILENLKKWETKLKDKDFIDKAPEQEINKLKERLLENNSKAKRIEDILKQL